MKTEELVETWTEEEMMMVMEAEEHQQMSKLGFEGYNLLKPPETSPNPPTPQLGPPKLEVITTSKNPRKPMETHENPQKPLEPQGLLV